MDSRLSRGKFVTGTEATRLPEISEEGSQLNKLVHWMDRRDNWRRKLNDLVETAFSFQKKETAYFMKSDNMSERFT